MSSWLEHVYWLLAMERLLEHSLLPIQ
uniref:Uncharacterized protein n=1 Tax=Rhizophora mucronata TaxID=61149 RepID=A0A2P2PH58_RHIMU